MRIVLVVAIGLTVARQGPEVNGLIHLCRTGE